MKARTEQEMHSMSPLKVKFGAKDYNIKPLPFGASAEWREKLLAAAADMLTQLKVQGQNTEEIVAGLGRAWFTFPKKMAELVLAYSPDLTEEIINTASEEQISEAFQGLMQMAFPFVPHLQNLFAIGKKAAANSISVPFTN